MIDQKLKEEVQRLKAKHNATSWQAYACYKVNNGRKEIIAEILANYPSVQHNALIDLVSSQYLTNTADIISQPEIEILMTGIEPMRPSVEKYLKRMKDYASNYGRKAEKFDKIPSVECAKKIFGIKITESQIEHLQEIGKTTKLPVSFYLEKFQYEKELFNPDINIEKEITGIERMLEWDDSQPAQFEGYSTRNFSEKFLRFKREKILNRFETQRILLEDYIDTFSADSSADYEHIEKIIRKKLNIVKQRLEKSKRLDAPEIILMRANVLIEERAFLLRTLVEEESWVRKYLKSKVK